MFDVVALLEASLKILVRSLNVLILFDLEFPHLGICPKHRVGDVDNYLQGAFAAFFLVTKNVS